MPSMLVLALDTTTVGGSVALAEDGRVIDEQPGDATRTHGERLPAELLALLGRHGRRLDEVQLFAVASGPGAFTGLRIGIATIQGLALSCGRQVVAISALEALAWAVFTAGGDDTRPLAVCIDAYRGEIYAAAYTPPVGPTERQAMEAAGLPSELGMPVVAPPAEVHAAWPAIGTRPIRIVGDGALAHRGILAALWPGAVLLDPVPLTAGALTRMAMARAARGEAVAPHDVRPFYLRRPDAERDRERRGAR